MASLAAAHEKIAAAIPVDQAVAFLDYSVAANVGDLLITLGTLRMFDRYGYRMRLARNLHDTEPCSRFPIERGDTLVLQGGGNFGDLYPHFQAYRERIVSEHPDRKIVILPQTIFFKDRTALRRSAAIFANHRDLKLFVRDAESLEVARRHFCADAELVPDMAHQLWPSLLERVSAAQAERRQPLYLLRRDKEQAEQSEALPSHAELVDWPDVVSIRLRAVKRLMKTCSKLQRRLGAHFAIEHVYLKLVAREVERIMGKLFAHDVWITSRLHGLISALLLAKPVFFIDNSYGKLSSYVDTWRDALDPVVRIETATDARRAYEVAESPIHRDERLERYLELCENAPT